MAHMIPRNQTIVGAIFLLLGAGSIIQDMCLASIIGNSSVFLSSTSFKFHECRVCVCVDIL